MVRKSDKFGGNSKNIRILRGSWGLLFQTPGILDTWWSQGATKCQGEWLAGLSRKIRGPRPCWTLNCLLYICDNNHVFYPTWKDYTLLFSSLNLWYLCSYVWFNIFFLCPFNKNIGCLCSELPEYVLCTFYSPLN